MVKNDDVFDIKVKFLYETGRNVADCYKSAILEAYDKIFRIPQEIIDEDNEDPIGELTPAEIIDNLACVMYEVEEHDKEVNS